MTVSLSVNEKSSEGRYNANDAQTEAEENNSIGVKLLRDMKVCDDFTGNPGNTDISDRAGRLNSFGGVNEMRFAWMA
jgi:hypothetical protein